ncbi:MAG: hexitol phosphatase HxpB [Bacteroidetes bacterium]|nr:MAG: hexitol phosphatase HxpB [Bacteroidota bacterium]
MPLNTVIFDMDGLLIDSEPYWQEAGMETLQQFDAALTLQQYHRTTGLRTREWIEYWFDYFQIDRRFAKEAEATIVRKAIEKIGSRGEPMPGVDYIFSFFKEKKFRVGLATSSPVSLIEVVVDKLGIRSLIDEWASAELLIYSKPHPQVYIDCAARLEVNPLHCLCFEDSFNGMIAVKAARMKCVVIPAIDLFNESKWNAADLTLKRLLEFDENAFKLLS